MYSAFRPELYQQALEAKHLHARFEEGSMSRAELDEYRRVSLLEVLDYAKGGSAHYGRSLCNLDISKLHASPEAILERLPFTNKETLRAAQFDMLAAPLDRAWIYYETTGTTGLATPCPRSETDSIHNNTPLILRYQEILKQHGDRHIIAVMGPTELHSTGDTFEDVFRAMGHTVAKMWPRSPVVGHKRALKLILELGVTALVCTPAVAVELARFARSVDVNPSDTKVKAIFVLGELTTPGFLRGIESLWGCRVYNCMLASQEASILAACRRDGAMYSIPLNNWYEIVDPDTGKPLAVDGSAIEGELVITHLYRGQKPLIRFRTGDMVRVDADPLLAWQVTPLGRTRDRIRIRDRTYSAYDIEAVIFGESCSILEYQLQITENAGSEELQVAIDFVPGRETSKELESLRDRVTSQLNSPTRVSVGGLNGFQGVGAMVSWKAARIHDTREVESDERKAARAIASARSHSNV